MDELRNRTYRADAALERRPRAWTHHAARAEAVPYAGFVSRGVAFAVDLLVVTGIFVIGSALAGLASSLVGGFRPQWLAVALAGVAAALLEIVYFAGFWALAGQTPGMRLMRLKVVGPVAARRASAVRSFAWSGPGSRSCRSASGCCRCSSTTGGVRCRTSSRARLSSATRS